MKASVLPRLGTVPGLLAIAASAACSNPAAPDVRAAIGDPHPVALRRPAAIDGWPMFRGDAAQRGVAPGTLADSYAVRWAFEAGGAIVSSPVVAGGVVYFGCDDYSLYAVDLATGEKRWSFATEDIIEAPPMVHDGTVYVGSSDYNLYAVDLATGELRWKAVTDDKILGGAAAVAAGDGEGTWILAGSYDTKLYCLDAATGEQVWTYTTDNYVNGTPAILDDKIVFGGCDAILHVVSTKTGEAVAKVELGGDCHIAGSVALADGKAYFGHYGNAFVCVDIATGEPLWTYRHPDQAFFSSPSIGEDVVVFGGRDRHLHCVDRKTGEKRWSFRTRRKVDGSPVISGDKVVFGGGDGWVRVLSLADGAEVWSYEIGRSVFSSPAVVDGVIVVGANDSRMYAFEPATPGKQEDR